MAKFLLKIEFPIILVAGILGQKIAATLWTKAFGDEVPDTAQERVPVAQLFPAAVLEGTLYKLARMAMDRGLRLWVRRSTGQWQGATGEGE